ncbi:MAG: U32 family peptidase [Acutalibacteraceae bacterium]|nr:U32 family peptidase [Acutalibacteraceae bacterium]
MKRVELLSPAGDMERLELAVKFGADAVYVGGTQFGMRSNPSNFDPAQLQAACKLVHAAGKKLYLTCNTLPRSYELDALPDFLRSARAAGVDAFIIADMGVLAIAKQAAPEVEVHISTQAGIVNYAAANAFYQMGAKRIVTARELSLDEIKMIRDHTPPELEIEAFVHGAMCMSFSGRCILSDYMVGRDANRGDCAQPCRWKYHLMEETRPGQYFPINQEENGTYIFNSKDLCMIEHIPELVAAGVDSFKIEGRAKSAYYTAVVTHAYRQALDAYFAHPSPDFRVPDWVLAEMEKMSHRVYTTGFNFGPLQNGQELNTGGYVRNWDVCALYRDQQGNRLIVDQRNRFFEGDILEVLEPGQKPYTLTVRDLVQEADGTRTEVANKATEVYSFAVDRPVSPDAILRRKRDED